MTNDFATYLAELIVDWSSQGSSMPSAPGSLWIALFDDTDTEVSGDFQNGRVQVTTPGGWNKNGSLFDNANDIAFGEATVDVDNLEDVSIRDSDTGGSDNELYRAPLDNTPFDVASGSTFTIEAGDLDVDILD